MYRLLTRTTYIQVSKSSHGYVCLTQIAEKLTDKEKSLEEEIQLRERIQLQCKQAERTVEDLQMELEAMAQSKEDVVKQLKQTQVPDNSSFFQNM